MGWWGSSRCSPGEFLAVDLSRGISRCRPDLSGGISFSSRDGGFCPGKFFAVDQTCPGEFPSVVVRGVSDSILIFMWLFNLSLKKLNF